MWSTAVHQQLNMWVSDQRKKKSSNKSLDKPEDFLFCFFSYFEYGNPLTTTLPYRGSQQRAFFHFALLVNRIMVRAEDPWHYGISPSSLSLQNPHHIIYIIFVSTNKTYQIHANISISIYWLPLFSVDKP